MSTSPWRQAGRAAALTLVLAVPGAADLRAAEDRAFEWSGVIARGRTIEIKAVHGDIRVEASRGDRVEVTAVKRGKRSDPGEVTIEVIEHAGGVTLCTKYPGSRNHCGVGDEGNMDVRRSDVSVDFTVRVPSGVAFTGRTSDLPLRVRGKFGPRTVRGTIGDGGGDLSLETVNGEIRLRAGS